MQLFIDVRSQAGNYLTSMYPGHYISDQVVIIQRNAYDNPIKQNIFLSKFSWKNFQSSSKEMDVFSSFQASN